MSIAFYDIFEPEADAGPAQAPGRRYRIAVTLLRHLPLRATAVVGRQRLRMRAR